MKDACAGEHHATNNSTTKVTANADSEPRMNSADDFEETLLYVHQDKWQRDLLKQYGNILTLSLKCNIHDLALFFLCIRQMGDILLLVSL